MYEIYEKFDIKSIFQTFHMNDINLIHEIGVFGTQYQDFILILGHPLSNPENCKDLGFCQFCPHYVQIFSKLGQN